MIVKTITGQYMSTPFNTHESKHYPVVVIGAGQAGMSMSYCLLQKGINHLVIERNKCVGRPWDEERWDTFCLVTPNWQCQLPGHHYSGNDPDGFMLKNEIVDYLNEYNEKYNFPIMFGTQVTLLEKHDDTFFLETNSKQTITADQVVFACGTYHKPNILPFHKGINKDVVQIHSRDYKNPNSLPEGEVLVIGTGQSGCQIAEDLHLANREVHLCVGPAPRVNRRYRGKDVVSWLEQMGYYKTTIDNHPDGARAPFSTNHYVTGRDGGRDLNLRVFAEQGMTLYGMLNDIKDNTLYLKQDLKEHLDYADNAAKRIRESIESYIQENNIQAPVDSNRHSDYTPEYESEISIEDNAITSVVWATGFKPAFDWVNLPIFSEKGNPMHKRGISPVDGAYFLGLNWMHTWGSGRFYQVGKDADYLSETILNKAKKLTTAKQHAETLEF